MSMNKILTLVRPIPYAPSASATTRLSVARRELVEEPTIRNQISWSKYADIYLSRNMVGNVVSVGTSPVLLINSPSTWPYIILNPTRLFGITKIATSHSGTITATTNTQSDYIEVSGYETAHLHLIITAVTGEWAIDQQSYDSISESWVDVQRIFSGITTTGSLYAMLGALGIAERLAFNFVEVSSGSITLSLAVTLKGGSGAGTSDYSNVIYLGNSCVTTVSGFPLLPGEKQNFIIGENVELWAIASETTPVRIFTL